MPKAKSKSQSKTPPSSTHNGASKKPLATPPQKPDKPKTTPSADVKKKKQQQQQQQQPEEDVEMTEGRDDAAAADSLDPQQEQQLPPPPANPSKPDPDRAALRQRYQSKIKAFLAARNADGASGKPARSRSELMAMRAAKEARRAARKKEERAAAKESQRTSADAEASRLRGGFGAAGEAGPGVPVAAPENFSFGRLDTDEARAGGKRRDARGALAVAEKRAARLAGFDDAKRAAVEDKDAWVGAQRRVDGHKVKDDAALLRRSLKRKVKAKDRSGREWKKREDGVAAGIRARQEKRQENLKKRRPGFEGTLKAPKRHFQ